MAFRCAAAASGILYKDRKNHLPNRKNRGECIFFGQKYLFFRKYVYICSPKPRGFRLRETSGEMPEWSIATVPGVRIPLSPQGTQGTLRKVAKNPVNHAFTGFLFLAKVLKKASESRLSVAYSVYFFSGRKSTPNCS